MNSLIVLTSPVERSDKYMADGDGDQISQPRLHLRSFRTQRLRMVQHQSYLTLLFELLIIAFSAFRHFYRL